MITLGPRKTDNNKQMITFTDYVLQWKPLNVITLSHIISDNNKQMITLTIYVLGTVEDALMISVWDQEKLIKLNVIILAYS